ncbi:hypothetical protein [Pseudomonas sp. S5D5]|uniref:hypothetical protein n=1 Tax=Pseudomonas sp. S5D5 TaxID=2083056 RepID=UPI0013006334|nr:hypothetical protein [Pseudomonas sp. S5D5]
MALITERLEQARNGINPKPDLGVRSNRDLFENNRYTAAPQFQQGCSGCVRTSPA